MTGGADKTVKFWDFELIKDQDSGMSKWVYYLWSQITALVQVSLLGFNILLLCVIHRKLTVKHTRTLQLDEDVLCVRYSPDQRLLAVSLLDCTVKIFYTDTLKVNHKNTGIALQYFTAKRGISCVKFIRLNGIQQNTAVKLELHLLRDYISPPVKILTLY